MPMRPGSMPHSFALPRTRLTARWASLSGPGAGTPLVSPARRDQHRRPGVFLLRGPINRERRRGDVGEPLRRLAADVIGFAADFQLEELLRADLAGVVAGRLAGPEVDHDRVLCRRGTGHE